MYDQPSEAISSASSKLTESQRQPRSYNRLAAGALLAHDITESVTRANVIRWLNKPGAHTETGLTSADVVAMLVGNKTDLEHLCAIPADGAKSL